jgi:hypothetical protein
LNLSGCLCLAASFITHVGAPVTWLPCPDSPQASEWRSPLAHRGRGSRRVLRRLRRPFQVRYADLQRGFIGATAHSRGGAFGTLFSGIASRRGLQCTRKQCVELWFVHRVRRIAINAAKPTSAGFHQHESLWFAALFAGGRWRVLGHR